jgi:hypothetical protein
MEDILALMIPIVAIIIGGLTVLIPITGLTARLAAKPIVEMIARAREQQSGPKAELLEKRFEALELQVEQLATAVERLVEEREFERRLAAGQPGGRDSGVAQLGAGAGPEPR